MNIEFWGALDVPSINLPSRPIGVLLLLALAFGLGYLIWRIRPLFATRRSARLTLLFAVLALIASQLLIFALPIDNVLPPIGETTSPQRLVHSLAGIPILAAAILFSPGAAALVGLASGLGRALFQTGSLFDPIWFGLLGWVLAMLIQQPYRGLFFRLARQSWLTSPISYLVLIPLGAGIGAFLNSPQVPALFAADLAISTFIANLVPAIVEGAAAALVIYILAIGIPELGPRDGTDEPAPLRRSFRRWLIWRFAIFFFILILLMSGLTVWRSTSLARGLILDQMGHSGNSAIEEFDTFLRIRQNLLASASLDERLIQGSSQENQLALQQWFSTGPFFRSIQLVEVSGNGTVRTLAIYPPETADTLSTLETGDLNIARMSGSFKLGTAESINAGQGVSLPLYQAVRSSGNSDQNGDTIRVLVARMDEVILEELLRNLESDDLNSTGFVVDQSDRIVAHSDLNRVGSYWHRPDTSGSSIIYRTETSISPLEGVDSTALQALDKSDNTRQLIYYVTRPTQEWTAVMVVPYDVLLTRAVQLSIPLTIFLASAALLFMVILFFMSRDIVRPLRQLVTAAEQVTAGQEPTSLTASNFQFQYEEAAILSDTFITMQRSLSQRLSELKLLLSVSQDVSAGAVKRLKEGVQPILRGAIRGTGASAARMMVLNPIGQRPIQHGTGAQAGEIAQYDPILWRKCKVEREMVLESEEAIRDVFELDPDTPLPFQAVVASAIYAKNRFMGVMWTTFRQANQLDPNDINLLQTLTNQAVTLTTNAHLYTRSQSQQERLNSILESTQNAVIVTDANHRVQRINQAMLDALDIKNRNEILKRPAAQVLQPAELGALLSQNDSDHELTETHQLTLPNERVYAISTSAIHTRNQDTKQFQGRVAVLNDITVFKEAEQAKTNFVHMVSHDLRSPLTVMNGFVSMLSMVGELNEKQMEYVTRIRDSITRMTTLINNLLNVGRLESGIQLVLKPVQLKSLIKQVIEGLQPAAEKKEILLVQKSTGAIPEIMLDYDLVHQAVENLINNAITHANGSNKVTIGVTRSFEELVISVQDNGAGIPPELQDSLYNKFSRRDYNPAQSTGSGLGLSIVKLIAESHHGRTWFKTLPGQGTTFYVALPIDLQLKLNAAEAVAEA